MFKNIYKDKSVLITGHTGFKGSWLTIWLNDLGSRVIGYSLDPPTEPNNFAVTELQGKITDIRGDVRDRDHVLSVFQEYRPDFVFHLAAQPIVRLSYEEPQLTFETNVIGTVNVLDAVRQTQSVRVAVNVTSDKCYENREWMWGYRENDPMGGHDPYSASKGCAELVSNAYLRSFFGGQCLGGRCVGAASARAGNVIGGGDWGRDRLIPDCIRELSANRRIGVRSPHAIRPWQHVLEPLAGYLWLGALLWDSPQQYSGAWNFGPDGDSHMAVAEVVERLIKGWGDGSWEDFSDPKAPHEANLLKLCCDKAHSVLGWYSILSIEECLEMTVEWYKKFYSTDHLKDMYSFCIGQIHKYQSVANRKELAWTKRKEHV